MVTAKDLKASKLQLVSKCFIRKEGVSPDLEVVIRVSCFSSNVWNVALVLYCRLAHTILR